MVKENELYDKLDDIKGKIHAIDVRTVRMEEHQLSQNSRVNNNANEIRRIHKRLRWLELKIAGSGGVVGIVIITVGKFLGMW